MPSAKRTGIDVVVPTDGATARQIGASIDVAMVGDYGFRDRSVDVTFVVGHELLEANPAGPL